MAGVQTHCHVRHAQCPKTDPLHMVREGKKAGLVFIENSVGKGEASPSCFSLRTEFVDTLKCEKGL